MFGLPANKKLKMRYLGDPVLSAKAKKIEKIDQELKDLAKAMIQCMYESDGVGLAANQIGLPIRMVVLHVPAPESKDGQPLPLTSPGEVELLSRMPLALVNPEIVSFSPAKAVGEEGCLSVPKLYAPVERPVSVVLKSQLIDGSSIQLECGGFLARAIQHELDHLDGIVYVQRVKDPEFQQILPALAKIVKRSGRKNYTVKRIG